MALGGNPTYDLAIVKQLVQDPSRYVICQSALDGAWRLEFDRYDIVDCVLALDETDFYKTMSAEKANGLMQDAYKPTYLGIDLYVKVQITLSAMLVVISFKEA